MKGAGVALAAALVAAPIHAQPPGDPYQQAVAARLRGEPADAVRLLEPLVAAEPGHSDAQVQLGYAYLALERLDEAERAFHAALAVAPGYADARLGLARVAQRRGETDLALRELAQVDATNAEAQTLRAQLESAPQEWRWQLDVDGSYAFVGGAGPDWKEGAIQLRHRLTDHTAMAGRIEYSSRFGLTDVYGEGSIDQAIGDGARLYLLLGGTPEADFRPRWQLGAGGSVRVRGGPAATVVTLDLRQADYVTGDVQTLNPGIEQYLLGGRAWITARWINTVDDQGHTSGYLLRGDLQASNDFRIYAGFSNAPDTSSGVVIDTRGYFGGISADIADNITLRLSAGFEDPEIGADRTSIGLGLGTRF